MKDVVYIRSKMDVTGCKDKVDSFWRYFKRDWTKKSLDNKDTGRHLLLGKKGKMMKCENGMDIVINRAKNAGVRHRNHVDEMRRIRNSKKSVVTNRPPARAPKIPEDFRDFVYV